MLNGILGSILKSLNKLFPLTGKAEGYRGAETPHDETLTLIFTEHPVVERPVLFGVQRPLMIDPSVS